MKKLTQAQFGKAVNFLKTRAQDIDYAMYEYFFERKPPDEVADILASYQNEDGGFGMLDYDIECPISCLKSTESACRYIFALESISAEHPMIQKLVTYVLEKYNPITGEWDNLTVKEINEYPHAPWWHHVESDKVIPKDRAELIKNYDPNTNSALAGLLVKYSTLVPNQLLDDILSIVIDKINSGYGFGQYGMNSDIYFINALNSGQLKSNLLHKVMGDGSLISLLDENWGIENAYKLCHWIDTRDHPYYPMYKDAVEMNFDFLINSQEEDGSWNPNWSWGEPDVWARVNKRLKGVLTMTFLCALKRFDRIVQ